MFCAAVIIAVLFAIFATAWGALIVQSLAGGGNFKTYFASRLKFDAPPDNDNHVILTAPFVFSGSDGLRTTARKGLDSDGVSVGFLLNLPLIGLLVRWLIKGGPLEGPMRPAAIPHDQLYGEAEEGTFWASLISSKRAIADRVIYEAAQCDEYRLIGYGRIPRTPLPRWRAFVVMALLRLAGGKAWRDDSRAARSLAKSSSPHTAF